MILPECLVLQVPITPSIANLPQVLIDEYSIDRSYKGNLGDFPESLMNVVNSPIEFAETKFPDL